MKKTRWGVGLAIFALLLPIMDLAAQEDDPPQNEGITVVGTIVNKNREGSVPEGLSIMMHAWDQTGSARGMVHGESGPGARFAFENFVVEADVFYAVMVIYQDATYVSEPSVIQEDGGLLPFNVEIYETGKDLSGVKIDLLQIIIGNSQGGLSVAEIYGLSNQGERTVAEAVTLSDGRDATIKFTLPEGAASVQFPGSSDDRFVTFPGGFADQKPLVPGEGSGQIFVSYILVYEDGISLTRSVPFDTSSVKLFIPHESGLSFVPNGAEYVGIQTSGVDEAYEQYSLGSLMAGEEYTLTLTGSLETPEIQSMTSSSENASINNEILIGLVVLGIVLISIGIWWWRRDLLEDDFEDEEPLLDA